MVDLDSDPTKLIEIVQIGKQLLMTRGAPTTFSIANDVAKYFASSLRRSSSSIRSCRQVHRHYRWLDSSRLKQATGLTINTWP
jgi:hypothetical protein